MGTHDQHQLANKGTQRLAKGMLRKCRIGGGHVARPLLFPQSDSVPLAYSEIANNPFSFNKHNNKIGECEMPQLLTIYWEIYEEGLLSFWKESIEQNGTNPCMYLSVMSENTNLKKKKVVLFMFIIFLMLSCTTAGGPFHFFMAIDTKLPTSMYKAQHIDICCEINLK